MNWYHRIKLAQLRGEWWIQDGSAQFADGDIGDYNHEGYVMETVQSRIMDSYREGEYWEDWKKEKVREIIEERGLNPDDVDDEEELLLEYLREEGVSDDDYAIAEGRGDAREYAMKKWGWKRMAEDRVETWTLTAGDLSNIASGIWDAYQEEAETATFSIYVYANKKWYRDIPYEVISGRNPAQLRGHMDVSL